MPFRAGFGKSCPVVKRVPGRGCLATLRVRQPLPKGLLSLGTAIKVGISSSCHVHREEGSAPQVLREQVGSTAGLGRTGLGHLTNSLLVSASSYLRARLRGCQVVFWGKPPWPNSTALSWRKGQLHAVASGEAHTALQDMEKPKSHSAF